MVALETILKWGYLPLEVEWNFYHSLKDDISRPKPGPWAPSAEIPGHAGKPHGWRRSTRGPADVFLFHNLLGCQIKSLWG